MVCPRGAMNVGPEAVCHYSTTRANVYGLLSRIARGLFLCPRKGTVVRYLVPLGAIGVLYIASGNDTTALGQYVTVAAAIMVMVTLVLAIGGNKKSGR